MSLLVYIPVSPICCLCVPHVEIGRSRPCDDQTHFATDVGETTSCTDLHNTPDCTTDAAGRARQRRPLSIAFTMLMLSKLHHILSRVLDLPDLHTAVLLTVTGELVSYASYPGRPKDEVRVVTGLATEIWQETREQGYGMVESEVS